MATVDKFWQEIIFAFGLLSTTWLCLKCGQWHCFTIFLCQWYVARYCIWDSMIIAMPLNRLKIAFFRNLDQNIQSWSEEQLKNETIFESETVSRFAIYDAAGQKKTLTLLCSCFRAVAAKCFTVCIFKCCGQDPFGQVQLAKMPTRLLIWRRTQIIQSGKCELCNISMHLAKCDQAGL